MNAPPEALSGELSEPALDLIDPRCRSRREVDVIVRPTGEPRLDLGRLVGGVVELSIQLAISPDDDGHNQDHQGDSRT